MKLASGQYLVIDKNGAVFESKSNIIAALS
jgi:hypothetical protein